MQIRDPLARPWVPDQRSGILILSRPSTSSFDKLRMRWKGVSKDTPHRIRDDDDMRMVELAPARS
jgi:hypothetical protein